MTTSRLAHQHHQSASNTGTSSSPPATTSGCPLLQRNSSFRLPHSPSWASSSTACPGRHAYIPDEKLIELRSHLDAFTACNSCTKRDLSLLGKPNFAASVFAAGRTFMRRLWDCASSMPELYHRVQLAAPYKADLRWRNYLLARWNRRSFFLHRHLSLAPSLHRCTDAAGSVGYGAYYNASWFCGTWTAKQQHCCIQYTELYPIALTRSIWGLEWSSRRIEFHSDNQAVVAALRNGTCRCAIVNLHAFWKLAPNAAETPTMPQPLPTVSGETAITPCAVTLCKPLPHLLGSYSWWVRDTTMISAVCTGSRLSLPVRYNSPASSPTLPIW